MSKKNILFFSLYKINSINDQGIYPDLLYQFKKNKFNIYILSPVERGEKIKNKLTSFENVTIIQVRTLKTQKTNKVEKLFSSIFLEYIFIKAYNNELKKIEFDLVLFPTPVIFVNNFLKRIKLSKNGIKYLLLKDIFPQNAIDLNYLKSSSIITRFFRRVESKLYNNVDYIGCMSEANKSYLINNNFINKKKIEVNPNSIELNKYPVLHENIFRKNEGISKNDLIFVYGGNLGKPQGINKIIKISEYIEKFSSIFFIICGKGTEEKRIKNFINKNGLKQTKLFTNLTKVQYLQIVNESNMGMVFLNKSFSIPNFPSRILDYMKYSLPVFSWTDKVSDIGDLFESKKAGFSFKSFEDFYLIQALIKKLTPKKLMNMGKLSHQILLDKFQAKYSYDLINSKLK